MELGYVLPLLDTVSALTDSGLVASKPRTVAAILVNKYICKKIVKSFYISYLGQSFIAYKNVSQLLNFERRL